MIDLSARASMIELMIDLSTRASMIDLMTEFSSGLPISTLSENYIWIKIIM